MGTLALIQAKTNSVCENEESRKVIGATQKVGKGFGIYSGPKKVYIFASEYVCINYKITNQWDVI